jgi:hypothetical protein
MEQTFSQIEGREKAQDPRDDVRNVCKVLPRLPGIVTDDSENKSSKWDNSNLSHQSIKIKLHKHHRRVMNLHRETFAQIDCDPYYSKGQTLRLSMIALFPSHEAFHVFLLTCTAAQKENAR